MECERVGCEIGEMSSETVLFGMLFVDMVRPSAMCSGSCTDTCSSSQTGVFILLLLRFRWHNSYVFVEFASTVHPLCSF